MEEKKVSVIIPLYNRKHLIERCVRSVQNQTYRHLEIIIVDDGSTDEPDEVLAALAQDERVRVIRKPNGGVSSARNAGLDAATGEYVQFLDSDDVLHPEATLYSVTEMEEKGVDCVSFAFLDWNVGSSFTGEERRGRVFRDEDCLKASFLSCRQCSPVNKLFRRSLIGSQRFLTNVSWGEDYIFNIGYLERCKTLSELSARLYGVQSGSEGSLNYRYHNRSFAEAETQYEISIGYLQRHPSPEMEREMQKYLWGCYAQCFRKLCLRSGLPYGECVRTLCHWAESEYVQWLQDWACPPVPDCRCARRKQFSLLPFVVRLQNVRTKITSFIRK